MRIAILVHAFLAFLGRFCQRFLELHNFLGELRKILLNGIRFLTAFLHGAEIGLLLSILLKPMTLTCVVGGTCAAMLLAQVAMLLMGNLLWHTDRYLSTGTLLTFLAPVRRLLGRF